MITAAMIAIKLQRRYSELSTDITTILFEFNSIKKRKVEELIID